MSTVRVRSRMVSALLICLMPVCMTPAFGNSQPSALAGVVLDAGTRTPLSGVRVHVADPAGDRFYVSESTGADGTFKVEGLPASDYEIGLERDGGLYLVELPVHLAPGRNHLVEVTLEVEEEEEDTEGATVWRNPLTAALLVTGSAIAIGLVLEEAIQDNERRESPLVP